MTQFWPQGLFFNQNLSLVWYWVLRRFWRKRGRYKWIVPQGNNLRRWMFPTPNLKKFLIIEMSKWCHLEMILYSIWNYVIHTEQSFWKGWNFLVIAVTLSEGRQYWGGVSGTPKTNHVEHCGMQWLPCELHETTPMWILCTLSNCQASHQLVMCQQGTGQMSQKTFALRFQKWQEKSCCRFLPLLWPHPSLQLWLSFPPRWFFSSCLCCFLSDSRWHDQTCGCQSGKSHCSTSWRGYARPTESWAAWKQNTWKRMNATNDDNMTWTNRWKLLR